MLLPVPFRTASDGRRARSLPTVVAACLIFASPVAADRHCYPSQDSYYDARQILMDARTDCPTRLAEAVGALRVAEGNAEICGCTALVAQLTDLRDQSETAPDCAAAEAAILAADTQIKAIVSACH